MSTALPTTAQNNDSPNSTIEELVLNADEAAKPDKSDKKVARWAFHATNFLGLHMAFNSTMSVLIAYNLLTTKFAQKMMHSLGESSFGRVSDKLFSIPGKAVDGVLKVCGAKNAEKILTEAEKAIEARHNARSSVETAFMCIAGFLALWPVKYMEDHRAEFMNTVDNWAHPGRSEAEKQAVALKPEDEPKESWTNLLRARFVALAAVFSVDRLQQRFNNWATYDKNNPNYKYNIDKITWELGAKASDNMGQHPGSMMEKTRNWLVEFFSRKGVKLSTIQEMQRDHLLEAIDSPSAVRSASKNIGTLQKKIDLNHTNTGLVEGFQKEIHAIEEGLQKTHAKDVQRAVFAEQSRLLLSKEIWLTTVMSVVIYTAAKAPFMARLFEKVGLKKPEHKNEESAPAVAAKTHTATTETEPQTISQPASTATMNQADSHTRWSTQEKPVEKPSKINRVSTFSEKLSREPETAAQPAL